MIWRAANSIPSAPMHLNETARARTLTRDAAQWYDRAARLPCPAVPGVRFPAGGFFFCAVHHFRACLPMVRFIRIGE